MTTETKNEYDIKMELMKYYNERMEGRRSLGFKAFLSLITLFLISLKGLVDFNASCSISNPTELKIIFTIIVLLLICFLFGFLEQIENVNKFDRSKYIKLQIAFGIFIDEKEELPAYKKESKWKTRQISWGSTWAELTALVVGIIVCYIVWQLK